MAALAHPLQRTVVIIFFHLWYFRTLISETRKKILQQSRLYAIFSVVAATEKYWSATAHGQRLSYIPRVVTLLGTGSRHALFEMLVTLSESSAVR